MDFFESRPTRHGITAVPVNSDTVHRYGSSIPTVDIQGQTETRSEKDKVRQTNSEKGKVRQTMSEKDKVRQTNSEKGKVRQRKSQKKRRSDKFTQQLNEGKERHGKRQR